MPKRTFKRLEKQLNATALKAAKASSRSGLQLREAAADALLDLFDGQSLELIGNGIKPYPLKIFHLVGRAYAHAVSRVGSEIGDTSASGVFYTPCWLSKRLVELVEEARTEANRALDPACGAGSLLLAWLDQRPDARLVGWEVDASALRLATALIELYAQQRGLEPTVDLRLQDLFSAGPLEADVEAVLMNPPFGTQVSGSALDYFRSGESTWSGREPDLFVLSLQRTIELAKDRIVGAIVPDVVRMQPEYDDLRRALTREGRVRRIEQHPFGSFPEAAVQPILLISGEVRRKPEPIVLSSQTGETRQLGLTQLENDPHCRWRLDDPRLEALWEKCNEGATPLGDIARCHEGVHTGNIRHKLFTDDPSAPDARPMLKGADVTYFASTFRDRYLRYNNRYIERDKGEYASLRDPEIFLGPKLLSRQTSDRLVVCLDRSDCVTDNTLHSIRLKAIRLKATRLKPHAKISLEWLAILLNSALATALYRFQSGESSRPLPQIKLTLLRKLPIREPTLTPVEVVLAHQQVAKEAATGAIGDERMRELNRIVFDSYGIPESDRVWIQANLARQQRKRRQSFSKSC